MGGGNNWLLWRIFLTRNMELLRKEMAREIEYYRLVSDDLDELEKTFC